MRTANPALSHFTQADTYRMESSRTMTLNGTAIALGFMLAACSSAAILVWNLITDPGYQHLFMPFTLGGLLGGLILGLIISFSPKAAPFLGVPYAVCEGAFLACFSLFVTQRWLGGADTGIIFQAIGATFAVTAAMLILYLAGIVRINSMAMKIMSVALGGLCLYALAILIGNGLIGLNLPNLFADASPLGIGFTILCIGLAAFFLVADFQFIEAGIANGAPKYMEWYGAFGLLVTLVWLYIEMLRLLAKLRR
ncbi:MAG: Bax inhibitor-1/YccA family protein [Phycisphaerales bacterium]|nr:Bax inhibitor-1/YccA family protein [Phycisphaerales bacterium]